jgi:protease-4
MIRSMVLDSYDWFVDLATERREHGRALQVLGACGRVDLHRSAGARRTDLVDAIGGEAEIRAYLEEPRC